MLSSGFCAKIRGQIPLRGNYASLGKDNTATRRQERKHGSWNRATGRSEKAAFFCWRDLRVDFGLHQVWRGGKPVPLTPREFALLEALLRHRNLTLTRDQLLQQAWGYDYAGESRTVDVHINRLRRKLGMEQVIQTVYRIGYRLVLPPEK